MKYFKKYENFNNREIYFGLTAEEKNNEIIFYPKTEEYSLKGVNLNKEGLKRFINDNDLKNEVLFYVILDESDIEIDHNINLNKKYDMIGAKLPILISLKDKEIYRL